MGTRGWVYVLINESIPGQAKVGFTMKEPALRAEELSTTGLPTRFIVAYDALVVDPKEVERKAHLLLDDYRNNKAREFFCCTVEDCVQALRNCASEILLENMYHSGDTELEGTARVDYLKLDALNGNVLSQSALAFSYEFGEGVPQDLSEAARWYRKAAEQSYPFAQLQLGIMYRQGRGVSYDEDMAVTWIRKAAMQGQTDAENMLGMFYEEGEGPIPIDLAEAVRWYHKAAAKGHTSSQSSLADLYSEGKGVDRDLSKSVYWYLKAANDGLSTYAQEQLGIAFREGQGVSQDYTEAYKWLYLAAWQSPEAAAMIDYVAESLSVEEIAKAKKQLIAWGETHLRIDPMLEESTANEDTGALIYIRAKQGESDQQYSLGDLYESGRDVRFSNARAAYWFEKAAEQGHTESQNRLGELYEARDPEKAMYWYAESAKNGHIGSQAKLGEIYRYGGPVSSDPEKSAYWYGKAAANGLPEAQYWLAEAYRWGDGVLQDLDQAGQWYRKAADQEYEDAQLQLGREQIYGKCVPKDLEQAKYWGEKAARMGDEEFPFALGEAFQRDGELLEAYFWFGIAVENGHWTSMISFLERDLTESEISEAKRRVENWVDFV